MAVAGCWVVGWWGWKSETCSSFTLHLLINVSRSFISCYLRARLRIRSVSNSKIAYTHCWQLLQVATDRPTIHRPGKREQSKEKREGASATMTENLNKPKLAAGKSNYYYYNYNYYYYHLQCVCTLYIRVCVWGLCVSAGHFRCETHEIRAIFTTHQQQKLQHATCVYAAIDKFCVCRLQKQKQQLRQQLHYNPHMHIYSRTVRSVSIRIRVYMPAQTDL